MSSLWMSQFFTLTFFPKTTCDIPMEYLRKTLELVLKCNNFKFDRNHFYKIKEQQWEPG